MGVCHGALLARGAGTPLSAPRNHLEMKMKPYFERDGATAYHGDCREVLAALPEQSVHTCVTSPPYWGLRDYGVGGQLGLEPTPEEYIANLVDVFREVRRVLRDDGTLWLNLGDSYAGSAQTGRNDNGRPEKDKGWAEYDIKRTTVEHNHGLKPKDLVGIPWRVALALQADGWWLRSDIIWAKPNPMPESVTDRPTKSHEYIFLLSKSQSYYYDADAIREPNVTSESALRNKAEEWGNAALLSPMGAGERSWYNDEGRNKRSVWTVATQPFSGSAFGGGRRGKVSQDCPVHGLRNDSRIPPTGEYGEPQAFQKPDNHGIDARLEEAPTGELSSTLSPGLGASTHASSVSHKSGSMNGSRSGEPVHKGEPQTVDHTDGIPVELSLTLGLPSQRDADSAIEHSSQAHKTGLAPSTNPSCKPSGQTTASTDDKPESPSSFEPSHGNVESKTLTGEPDWATWEQKQRDIADKCTCSNYSIDHFAVFPEKLIEPCILAGSAFKTCRECGNPWKRQVDRTPMEIDRTNNHPSELRTRASGTMTRPATSTTTGFAPSCEHDRGTVGGVVLDPFAGSCTTGVVARKHGRRAILIDANSDYLDMGAQRMSQSVMALDG